MRKIEEYLKKPYKIEVIPDMEEGGYAISCPELPGCISCGDTIEEAMRNIEDAKIAWLNAGKKENILRCCLEEIIFPCSMNILSGIFLSISRRYRNTLLRTS